jgi:hypothetical protein
MSADTYYLITALPTLGRLGDTPEITLTELVDHIADDADALALTEAILLSDDLLQRDAVVSGELAEPQPVVLTAEQLRDDAPLPESLVADEGDNAPIAIAADAVWAAYFRHAAATAARLGSAFLADWVGYEVAVRNGLAEARARTLDLSPERYRVCEDLADGSVDLDGLLREWAAARDPLAGLKVLDEARWAWLHENDRWYSFSNDELAAYAAKLMLLNRWVRLSEPQD